jgi:hypothetical protein
MISGWEVGEDCPHHGRTDRPAPGLRGLLERVGIDTTGHDIRVGDQVVDAWDTPDARPGTTDHTLTRHREGEDGVRDCGLTEVQMAYNAAQYEVFQLAAYGHHRFAPLTDRRTGEYLSISEIEAGQRDYNDRIQAAREELEAAVLRLVAEHGETYRTLPEPVVGWLRTLADDPAELSLLAVRPDEREEIENG